MFVHRRDGAKASGVRDISPYKGDIKTCLTPALQADRRPLAVLLEQNWRGGVAAAEAGSLGISPNVSVT